MRVVGGNSERRGGAFFALTEFGRAATLLSPNGLETKQIGDQGIGR
jgi:hypothetical protein